MPTVAPAKPWPILRALQGWSLAELAPDLLAGLTLAAIAVPEQMATARLGGFPPEVGFFAFVAATIGFVLFGASRPLSAGADSTITPIFAGALAAMAASGSYGYASLAAALAVMVGVVLVVAGVARLGWIADLLSSPIVTGFLAGIAIHIVISQAPAVLGLPEETGSVYQRLGQIAEHFGAANSISLGIGLGVFAIVFVSEKLNPRIPGALIAVGGATLAVSAFGLDRRGVAVLGRLPNAWPSLHMPAFGLEHAIPLASLSLVIALVVMVQTAATSRAFAEPGGEANVDRDFVGLGVAGVLAGLFGAFPVNASPPRTAIVRESGGRSQVAGLAAAAAVLLVAAFGAGLLERVPTAALAGVLLFVAQRIFRVRDFAGVLRRAPTEFGLAAATTVLIVVLPIQTGVAIGIFLSMIHGVFVITRVRPIAFEPVAGTTVWWPAPLHSWPETKDGVLVIGFQAPLSFLNAAEFQHGMTRAIDRADGAARLLVLEASSIVEIDYTAAAALLAVIAHAHERKLDFAVARLESVRAQAAFARFGIINALGPGRLFHSVHEAILMLRVGDG